MKEVIFNFVFLVINLILVYPIDINGQNTVGLIYADFDNVSDGYNLFFPEGQSNVYLMDNCGREVHKWVDMPNFRPGGAVYLLKNGNLLKTKKSFEPNPNSFSNGGAGGIIEIRDWDNNLLWSKSIIDETRRAHHDVAPMENGNILVLLWDRKFKDELITAGRDTSIESMNELWPDAIHEYDPVKDSLVWEWYAWDHLIQSFDSTKENFGDFSLHPELIHLNHDIGQFGGRSDWMHSNSIDYHEELDQILLSVGFFNELWIIDHSATTSEASEHEGGNFNMGGDLIYRWGNTGTYNSSPQINQHLFFQHDVHWIDDSDLESSQFFNDIILFNNRISNDFSAANIIEPAIALDTSSYIKNNGRFLPTEFKKTIKHPVEKLLHSTSMSSVQVLPNENFLLCSSREGTIFEISDDNKLVWQFKLPFKSGLPVLQGSELNVGDNSLFRFKRYAKDYMAFENRDLTPQNYLELEPNVDFCNLISSLEQLSENVYSVYFDNYTNSFNVKSEGNDIRAIRITNMHGMMVSDSRFNNIKQTVIISDNLQTGIYIVTINNKDSTLVYID